VGESSTDRIASAAEAAASNPPELVDMTSRLREPFEAMRCSTIDANAAESFKCNNERGSGLVAAFYDFFCVTKRPTLGTLIPMHAYQPSQHDPQ
jgi:hypothetical protein